MRVGIDLDGVAYDFVGHLKPYAEDQLGGSPLDATKWDFYEDWGLTSASFWDLVKMAHEAARVWHASNPVVPGTKEALEELGVDHEIVIVTTRPEYAGDSTENWLQWNAVYHDELIFAEDKTKWNLDVLLDDAPHNIEQAQAAGIRAIIWDQPWNRHVEGERVCSWDEFVDAINCGPQRGPEAPFSLDFTTLPDDLTEEEIAAIDAPYYAPPARAELLREAEALICGDRNNQYGPPDQDFTRTAAMWSAWKGVHFDPHEVAAFLMLLKLSRIRWQPEKKDSWADTVGYAGCGWETFLARGVTPDPSLG